MSEPKDHNPTMIKKDEESEYQRLMNGEIKSITC